MLFVIFRHSNTLTASIFSKALVPSKESAGGLDNLMSQLTEEESGLIVVSVRLA